MEKHKVCRNVRLIVDMELKITSEKIGPASIDTDVKKREQITPNHTLKYASTLWSLRAANRTKSSIFLKDTEDCIRYW